MLQLNKASTVRKTLAVLMLLSIVAGCARSPTHDQTLRNRPGPSPVLDAPTSLPAALIVSTNEPFWQLRVEGAVAVLSGPAASRSLRVQTNDVVFDGRYLLARDATGVVEARVAGRLCQDSMSGAVYPYTARLTIDGGTPILGCARGVNDPRPGEPRP
jgi:uncharacterized membrane protein